MKLVSIIVPVYNRCEKVKKYYDSLINQTYKNIEIIFVYDETTDNILDLLNSFLDDRVVIVSMKNRSLMDAMGVGFNKSHGEYICFVDSNDTIDKDYISKLVMVLERDGSNIAMGRIGGYCYHPVIKNKTLKSRRKPNLIDLEKRREYLPALTSSMVGKLFKREILDLKNFKCNSNEDIMIMYPLYVKCRYISICNDCIYHYKLAENSQFKKNLFGYSLDNLMNTFESLKYIYYEIEKMGKLDDYFYEIEMLFIKNIFGRICNIIKSVDDKIYRYKFISVILDYLECFFPDWDSNPYFLMGYKLGEVTDRFNIKVAYNEISMIKRKKLFIKLENVYEKYRQIEDMYNRSK